MADLSHIDDAGGASMVDVGGKPATHRKAVARGEVRLPSETRRLLAEKALPKGDVLTVAQVAGILGAKRTSDLIPMCHNIALTHLSVELEPTEYGIEVRVEAVTEAQTGVEMEALVAVSVAALTIYDMCKSAGHGISITNIELISKTGGKPVPNRREGSDWQK